MPPSALRLAAKIRSGELSSEQLVEHYLARIERFDPELQSFLEVFAKAARRDSVHSRHARSDLAGVPVAVKDLTMVRGSHVRIGSAALRHTVTPFDDVLIRRLRRAGLILLGKTTMSEFGLLPITEPAIHPPTRNPFNREYTSGGSSGGSAAAVSAELVPWALGSDGGGSIRIPSAFCGVVGMKPSRGLVNNPFMKDGPELIWLFGPIAHSVVDAAALLDLIAVALPSRFSRAYAKRQRALSGWPRDVPVPNFENITESPRRPLRVRWTTESPLGRAIPDIHEAVVRAADELAALGYEVEEGSHIRGTDPYEFLPIWQQNAASAPVLGWKRTEEFTRWLGIPGRQHKKADIVALIERIRARVLEWYGDADLWLTPTVPVRTPRVGQWQGLPPKEMYDAAAEVAAFTAVFNISGQPAISLPAGFTREGLPIGVQLVGPPRSDRLLLQVAHELSCRLGFAEQRRAFAERRPWFEAANPLALTH